MKNLKLDGKRKIFQYLFISIIFVFQDKSAVADVDIFLTKSEILPTIQRAELVNKENTKIDCVCDKKNSNLSLFEAVERALCNNATTKQSWENSQYQAAQLGIAKSAYLPILSANLVTQKGSSSTGYDGFPQYDSFDREIVKNDAVNLSLTLFDFGARNANVNSAYQLVLAANAGQESAIQSVFINTAQAYYDYVTAEEILVATKDAESSAKENFDAANSKYSLGAGTLADKLQAQTNYAQAHLNVVKANGDSKDAEGKLAVTIGLSANTKISIAAQDDFVQPENLNYSISKLIELAKINNPTIGLAKAQLRSSEAARDMIKAQGLPSVQLIGGFTNENQSGHFPATSSYRTKEIGIQINIPLFEGFSRNYQLRAASAQIRLKEANLEDAELQTSLLVWENYQGMMTQFEYYNSTNELLQIAARSYEVAQGRYMAGVGNILDLLSAQSSLANARLERVQALSNLHLMRFKLASSLGTLAISSFSSRH
jgi:outer membrane protein